MTKILLSNCRRISFSWRHCCMCYLNKNLPHWLNTCDKEDGILRNPLSKTKLNMIFLYTEKELPKHP